MEIQSIVTIIAGAVSITVVILKSWEWLSGRFNQNRSHISSLKSRVAVLESKLKADIEAEPDALLRLVRIETDIAAIKESVAHIMGRLDSPSGFQRRPDSPPG